MDWFERITGFRERGYAETQALLAVEGGRLVSPHSPTRFRVGALETPKLGELRTRVRASATLEPNRFSTVYGDVRKLHGMPANSGALFQAASQFNLLEMVGPDVTPEHGVTRYANDPTQGPACAVAAGAGTIYRNYLADVDGHRGQTAERQIDCLADVGRELGNTDGQLWTMRNGYAIFSAQGLASVHGKLQAMDEEALDALRSQLRTGLHWDVDVTDAFDAPHTVSQAYCSALPIAYNDGVSPRDPAWEGIAQLVLTATYEATLLAGMLNARRGASNVVYLTRVGGGVFGNPIPWIDAAIQRAMALTSGLDVRQVAR